jgi:hypothetical protein
MRSNTLVAVAAVLFLARAFAADDPVQPAQHPSKAALHHRYLVERTLPPGALKSLDAGAKKKLNATNASVGVRWVMSYVNTDGTKTFCIDEGPSEAAVRKASELNNLPVDSVTEIPVTVSPK